MRTFTTLATLGITLLLAACSSSPLDPAARNFVEGINLFLADMGPRCEGSLTLPLRHDTSEIEAEKKQPTKVSALLGAGLLQATDGIDEHLDSRGRPSRYRKPSPYREYTLTPLGEQYAQVTEASFFYSERTNFCWGHIAVDKIVRWQGPKVQGDYREVNVTFTFKVVDMPAWAHDPAIEAAFGLMRKELAEAGNKEVDLKLALSTDGWRVLDPRAG